MGPCVFYRTTLQLFDEDFSRKFDQKFFIESLKESNENAFSTESKLIWYGYDDIEL